MAMTCLLFSAVAAIAAPPEPAAALNAWTTARSWLDRGRLPALDADASAVAIEGLDGASVVLRLNGRTVGSAAEFADDDRLLRRVVGRALAQALGDRTLRGLPAGLRDEAPQRLTLELELAGERLPLLGGDLSSAISRIRPGLDGIAVRRGDDWAQAFPGRLLSTGTADSATSTILRMFADLGLPPRDLPELRRIDRVGIYRFDTRRLAQSTPDGLPFQAERSGAYVPRDQVQGGALAEFGESVLRHLLTHCTSEADQAGGAPTLLGDFDPVGDRYLAIEASPLDQALVAWSLAMAANTEAFDPALRTEARTRARQLLENLAGRSPETAAITLDLTVIAASALAGDGETPDPVATAVLKQFGPQLLQEGVGEGSAADRIRRAAAMVAMPERVISAAGNDQARRALDLAWTDAENDVVISNFDWFVLAERAMGRRTGRIPMRAITLMDARANILARRINQERVSDLDGGVTLQRGAEHLVDARILRIAIGLAMLEDLESGEVDGVSREGLEGLLRFARQLQLTPDDAALFRGGHRAIGGLRQAPWNPSQPLAAEATALRLICECLD